MRYVVAIDVGVVNLGICVFDFRTSKIVFWDNVSLTKGGRYRPTENVKYVRDFVQKYEEFFEDALAVLVERQMRCNMRIIEAVLQTLYYERCHVIAPRSIKAHYKISGRSYAANKKLAVEWVAGFLDRNVSSFAEQAAATAEQFASMKKKRDDLADAMLLLLYYLDTYSNSMRVDIPDDDPICH